MKRCILAILLILAAASLRAQTWERVRAFDFSAGTHFINERIGFVYTGGGATIGGSPIRLFRTSDGGQTWDSLSLPTSQNSGGQITQMSFSSASFGVLAAYRVLSGDAGGIFVTEDTGKSWRQVSPDSIQAGSIYTCEGKIIALTSCGLLISADTGGHWYQFDGTPPGPAEHQVTGYNVTGNTDNIVSLGDVLSSSDLGDTWQTMPSSPHGTSPYCYFPRGTSCMVRTATSSRGSGLSTVELTTDFGQHWSLSLIDSDYLRYNTVDGPLCRLFIQQSKKYTNGPGGFLRSLDSGKTWRWFDGPGHSGWWYWAFSVVGRGNVVYALDDDNVLWRTRNAVGVVDSSVLPHLQLQRLYPDTVRTWLCDSATIKLRYLYSDCDHPLLKTVTVEGGVRTHIEVSNSSLTSFRHDTSTITFIPSTPGTFNLAVHSQIEREDFDIEDTLSHVVLIVSSNPGTLSVSNRGIDFGAQTMCSAIIRSDTIRMSATGCEPVQVDSIVFRPANGTSTDFSFFPPPSFAVGSSDKPRTFPITFKPTHPAKESATIYIYSSNGVDSILVMGEGVADSRAFIADRDTLHAQMCDSATGLFRLTNTTCGTIVIDSITLREDFTLPLASNGKPQLPLALGRDQSEDVTLRFAPSLSSAVGVSAVTVTAHVRYLGKGDTVAFDTVLTLPLVISRGVPSLALSQSSLDLGDVSTCASDTVALGILSDGCDTLSIQSATLASGAALTLIRAPAANIATGSGDSVTIRFAPSTAGGVFDTLIVVTNAGTKRVPITANGVAGTKAIAQSVSAIDFGTMNICQDSTQSITLTNKGCDTLTISSADLIGKGFVFEGSLPITLKPGESTRLSLSTTNDTTGHPTNVSGTVSFTSTAQNALPPITLSRSFTYPSHLKIESVDNVSAKAGEEVKFNLVLEGEVPKGMTALHFDLTHNDDLLGFEALTGNNLSIVSTTGHEQQMQSFTLTPITATGIIGELTFQTYLAKASTTSLTLSNLHFDYSNLTIPPECIASLEGTGSVFNYVYDCGDGLIQGFLQKGATVADSYPNPVRTVLHVPVNVNSGGHADLELRIVDAKGVDVLTKRVIAPSGSQVVAVDVHDLTSGNYLCIVMLGSIQIGQKVFQIVK
jgi:hypothetical protein